MRYHVAKLVPALLVGGCSLIYNPSNIDKPRPDASDAQSVDMEMIADAAIDAPPLADVNPAALTLEKLAPLTLYEGQGVGGSRQALVVIRGHHIVPSATVTITPTTDLTQGTPVFSMNGDFVLVPVSIAISAGMDTELVDLTVTVDQPGATQMLAGQLKLQYLPEFPAGTSIDAGALAGLYSSVSTGNVTFTGTVPAIVRAVSSITIGNITVKGGDASAGTGGTAGPGGCAGGDEGASGGCPGFAGGGLGGAGNNGGGGGGFGATGTAGVGGAAGGAMHGNAQIVNYAAGNTDSNRSGGGGGGNAGVVTDTGGGGGGGGGTVELTAGGDITTGSINANGGAGEDGSALAAAGGGGGGSGGVIVIRSVAGMIAAGGAITASGGAAGANAGGGGAGGTGAEGRIRIDSPVAAPPSTTPPAHRGPTYAVATPTYVTTVSPNVSPVISLFGANGDNIDGYVVDMDGTLRLGEPVDKAFANGTVDVVPTLIFGYNKLCFTLDPAVRPMTPVSDPLADSCIEIAYLP